MRHDKLDGTHPTEEAQVSRRSVLLGPVATGAFAVPLLSTSTQAAVSMLRSGIDPDPVESEIIPAGKRVVAKEEAARDTGVGTRDVVAVRAMGARDMGVDIGGTATARAAVAFTTTPIMGAVGTATAAITADMAEAATIPGTAVAIGIAALAGTKEVLPG